MADKEINIKVTANTDDAKKGIAEVTNELEKMSTSGSGKAADELDKVTEAADKAGDATDKLVSSWAAYKQNVREAEAEVRKLNATQFENAEQRDAAINALGDKLDELVYEGKAIEDSVKAIGISPESLQGFDSITATLNRANKEFEIALNYKEKLLNQPTAPANALVTTNPWEEGPDGGGPAEFKARMEEMRAELEAYAAQMGNAIAANDQMKSALEAELASLDKSSAGYAEQKKLLEGLISACDSYAVSSETQRQSIQKQKDSLDELNKETLKSEKWEEGLKSLDKYGEGVVATSLKVQKSVGSQIAIQNRYENAVLSAQQKELKGQAKLQAQMEIAGKSREELIRLVEKYGKALANAQTKEEYEAAAAGISAARKQLTLLTREASLTGSAMIGSQTSVQGLVSTIGRLGVQGRLTFKALSDGIKLFAKSTLVLAGIQFAWEALSKIYEKVKGDLFGVAEAEEEAAAKAERLFEASKDAADKFVEAQDKLREAFAEKDRIAAANEYKGKIQELNTEFKAQVDLINQATAAILSQQVLTTKDAEHEIAKEKLQLQRELMEGTISEYDYKNRLLALDEKSAELKAKANVEAAKAKTDAAAQKTAAAKARKEEAEAMDAYQLGESPEVLRTVIEQYNKNEAKIQANESKRKEREDLKKSIERWKISQRAALTTGRLIGGMAAAGIGLKIKADEESLAKLDGELKALDELEEKQAEIYQSLPKMIQEARTFEEGLAKYEKDQAFKRGVNEQRVQAMAAADKDFIAAQKEEKSLREAEARVTKEAKQTVEHVRGINNEKRKTYDAEKKINEDKKATDAKVAAAEKVVKKMEFEQLKKEAERLSSAAKGTGENTPEGKNARRLAGVYTAELTRRLEEIERNAQRFNAGIHNTEGRFRTSQGKAARGYITEGLSPDTYKESTLVNNLAEIGQEVVSSGKIKKGLLDKIEALAKQVQATSGMDDDLALERIIQLLVQVLNATEKNKNRINKATKRLNALSKLSVNLDA